MASRKAPFAWQVVDVVADGAGVVAGAVGGVAGRMTAGWAARRIAGIHRFEDLRLMGAGMLWSWKFEKFIFRIGKNCKVPSTDLIYE